MSTADAAVTLPDDDIAAADIDGFIVRWAKSGGAESANFQSFANELCDLLGLEARPFNADRQPVCTPNNNPQPVGPAYAGFRRSAGPRG